MPPRSCVSPTAWPPRFASTTRRSAERVRTIHNGIDTARFAPGAHADRARELRSALRIPQGRLVAAFVASEWERKGLDPLIRALALAPGWELVVAGGGDEGRYRELAEALDVGERVHWLGVTRAVEVVYGLADAFVLPTDYESFSLVTLRGGRERPADPGDRGQRRARADRRWGERVPDRSRPARDRAAPGPAGGRSGAAQAAGGGGS